MSNYYFTMTSFRMLTMCLIAAVLLNFSNYIFMKFRSSEGQKAVKFGYLQSSVEEVQHPLVQEQDDCGGLPCGNEAPSMAGLQENNSASLSSNSNEYNAFDDLNKCPELPTGLGPISDDESQITIENFESKYGFLKYGGIYEPTSCEARHSVAVIIAYRGCRRYLALFLFVLHPVLIKQQLDYQVFVIEQKNSTQMFNRGQLLNIGFREAQKYRKQGWTCFIFHEAHIIPTDTRNLYRCSWYPKQLAYMVERPNKPPYIPKFGGAVAMSPEQFAIVNGFSNNYWGNDADFEDLYNRILMANYFVENSIPAIGRYKTLKKYSGAERVTSEYISTVSPLYLLDGLTSLTYKVEAFELRRMYTYIKVNIGENQNDTDATSGLLFRLLNPTTGQTTQKMVTND